MDLFVVMEHRSSQSYGFLFPWIVTWGENNITLFASRTHADEFADAQNAKLLAVNADVGLSTKIPSEVTDAELVRDFRKKIDLMKLNQGGDDLVLFVRTAVSNVALGEDTPLDVVVALAEVTLACAIEQGRRQKDAETP